MSTPPVPGLRKPAPPRPSKGPAPGMPGTDDDLDDLDLEVKAPAPPLKEGVYVCRLSRIQVWPAKDDGSRPDPTFFFVVCDETERQKAERGEPSFFGEEVRFNYHLDDAHAMRKSDERLIDQLGYPAARWPDVAGKPGRKSLGGLIKLMRAELIKDPPSSSPTFKVTIKVSNGKGDKADQVYINVNKIERVTKKATPDAAE